MGCTEDKLVLFFPPESWDNGQPRYEDFWAKSEDYWQCGMQTNFIKKIRKKCQKPTSRNERVKEDV